MRMTTENQLAGYEISTDPNRLQIGAIHAFLSRSYWSSGIPLETTQAAIRNSLCLGVFYRDAQVGFARVVTDRATFAYLCDVYVLDEHRGQGLGTRLIQAVMAHPDLQGLRRLLLVTRDAHALYAQFGFGALGSPARFMEINRPDIYQTRAG